MRMTRDEGFITYLRSLKLIDDEVRKKKMVKRVAQAIKRPSLEDRLRSNFKATERYGFGYTDTRGIYGSTE